MLITFHGNPSQPHQREHGEWLRSGFKRHGIDLIVTPDINAQADVHIVSGPHYAKDRWLGYKTILLDRAYIPAHQIKTTNYSEDWVSLGWMNSDGGRDFKTGTGRDPITVRDRRSATGSIFLADYDGSIDRADTVRQHPQREQPAESLRDALRRHKTAIGYQTTALVAAGLEGLDIVCKDSRNIMYQDNWLELLPYADWHYSEIQSGAFWEHLCHSL